LKYVSYTRPTEIKTVNELNIYVDCGLIPKNDLDPVVTKMLVHTG